MVLLLLGLPLQQRHRQSSVAVAAAVAAAVVLPPPLPPLLRPHGHQCHQRHQLTAAAVAPTAASREFYPPLGGRWPLRRLPQGLNVFGTMRAAFNGAWHDAY